MYEYFTREKHASHNCFKKNILRKESWFASPPLYRTANTEAPINPALGGEGSYFVEQDDARREANVDQQVEVGQHELPADHLRRAARRPVSPGVSVSVAGRAASGARRRGGGCGK
jgi:hypothetical protein